MDKFIDKKILVTSLVVLAIAFFAKKWFTKTVVKTDGSTSSFVGHDAVGYV